MSRSAYQLDSPRHDEMTRAACRDHDPDMWEVHSPALSDQNLEAQRICRRECPVRVWCFGEAVRMGPAAAGMIYGGYRFPLPGSRLMDVDAVYGLSAAANRLGVSKGRVRSLIDRGALSGFRDGQGPWRVRVADVEAYLRGA